MSRWTWTPIYEDDFESYDLLGPALTDDWTNSPTWPWDTLTSSGVDVSSAISNGVGHKFFNETAFSIVLAKKYKIELDLTLNSGAAPKLYLSRDDGGVPPVLLNWQLSSGYNEKYQVSNLTAADEWANITLYNLASNIAIDNFFIKQCTSLIGVGDQQWTVRGGSTDFHIMPGAVSGKVGEITEVASNWGSVSCNDSDWASATDYRLEFDVDSHAGGRWAVFVRLSASGGYAFQHAPGLELTLRRTNGWGPVDGETHIHTYPSPPASVDHVKIEVVGTSLKIWIDDVYQGEVVDATHSSGTIGIRTYSAGWVINNIVVSTYQVVAPTHPLTNVEYLERSLLNPDMRVTFQLNQGTSLGDEIDITKYVIGIGSLSEKLTKSSVDVGGVILPNLSLSLDNKFRDWDERGIKFSEGFINNSVINIYTKNQVYTEHGAFDELAFSNAFDVGPGYRDIEPGFYFQGLIKTLNCIWEKSKFRVSLIALSNLFKTHKVQSGILSTGTFKETVLDILNRAEIKKYLTVSLDNINPGYDPDDTEIVKNEDQLEGKTFKEVLDEIAELSGSIYYIDYDKNFIFEPIHDGDKTVANGDSNWTISGDDILSYPKVKYNRAGHFTSFKYTRDSCDDEIVEMPYADRETYQYDFRQKVLSYKSIGASDRDGVITYLLSLHQHLKREVSFKVKWNPALTVNKCFNFDLPKEVIISDDSFIWNDSDWNDNKYWNASQSGISFNTNTLWRVIEIKRAVDGRSMTVKGKIYTIGVDEI